MAGKSCCLDYSAGALLITRQASTKPKSKLVHTAGEAFDDGSIIDLLQGGKLILWDGKRETVSESITHARQIFQAAALPEAPPIPLPSGSAPYGSTAELFHQVSDVFVKTGLPEELASLLSYFVFCTWFADLLDWVPSLLLHGEWADCVSVAAQMAALCRRSLSLSEFS